MSACKFCHAEIKWVREGKSWRPINPDGSPHTVCRKRKRGDNRLTHVEGERITGPLYKPSCGECTTPPWETCACSALMPA